MRKNDKKTTLCAGIWIYAQTYLNETNIYSAVLKFASVLVFPVSKVGLRRMADAAREREQVNKVLNCANDNVSVVFPHKF